LYDKINAHYKNILIYKEYFFDIYTQPNSNITIIENLYDNLLRSHSSINDFLENNFRTFKSSINSFENNLKFLEKINLYFSTYKNFLNLAENEKPVYAIYAKLTNGLNTEDKLKKDKGILFITNLDLSFVHEYGVRKKKQALIFKAPVGDLTRIKDKGKVFKKLYIEFEYGKYEFTLPHKSLSRVIEYILLARTFDETTVYDRKSATNLQRIDIDLNGLIDFIEESINSFFSLKCQYNKSYENTTNITNPPANSHLYPNPNRNLNPQNYPYEMHYQNLNIGHPQRMQNVNYQNHVYPQYGPNHTPQVFNNNQTGEFPLPLQGQSKFFPQNIYKPNRYQNYNPQEVNEVRFNPYDNDILVRNLQQPRTYISQNSNYINQDIYNEKTFQDYSKNHLSDLFNSTNSPIDQSYGYKRKLFKLDKEKQERMLELEKERYSLKATLKKLETKFDQGSISESDYFRTYRNLNKEIYLIDNKIQSLQQSLEELESIKQNSRSFDNKGFYT
jgi:hypothetical protein